MDVEAQDDGVLAKIVVPDGTKSVSVGKTIAVLAEQGDDISSVQVPTEDTPAHKMPSKKSEPAQLEQNFQSQEPKEPKPRVHPQTPYTPAVLRLLKEYDIEDPDSITATGPQGRLLKGDVLAYVGNISDDVVKNLENILEKKQHLDLSNITIRKPSEPSQAAALPAPKKLAPLTSIDTTVQITELLRLQQRLAGA